MIVAIDGPAGAGKSSVAQASAAALGFGYLNSGAMYRCVALAAQQSGRPPAELAGALAIEPGSRVLLDGSDVSEAIRDPAIAGAASRVAADPAVRAALVAKQRELLARGDWVAEGRDVGSVVAPDAELKLFLTAAADERVRRRAEQEAVAVDDVARELAERDRRDREREHSPLLTPAGAIELDTTGLSLQQVVERVVELARARGAQVPPVRDAAAAADGGAR